jgi:hypothetical protein
MHKVVALALLSGATALAQRVNVEFDRSVDFSKFHTFAIRAANLNSKNPALNSELVRKQIDEDIIHLLTAKRLEVTTGRADLNVRYTLGSVRRVETEAYPAGWYGWGTRIVRVPYARRNARDRPSRSIHALARLALDRNRRTARPNQASRQIGQHGEEVVREVSAQAQVSGTEMEVLPI